MSLPFCRNCNNIYDLTKEVKLSTQSGGTEEDKEAKDEADNKEIDNFIQKVLDMKEENEEVTLPDSITMNDLTKTKKYKNLTSESKEKVANKFQELRPKEAKRKKPKKNTDDSKSGIRKSSAFFICRNCNYSEPVKSGTLIYSQTISFQERESVFDDYRAMKDNPILRHTRAYICRNSKCPTIKDPSKRDAVMFRKDNGFQMIYVCCVCDTAMHI